MVQFEMSFIDKGGLDKVTGVGLLILESITKKDGLYYDVKFLSLKQHQLTMGISTANFRSNKLQKMAYDVKVLCTMIRSLVSVLSKSGLISENFSIGLHLQKEVPNHYPEHLLFR